MNHENRPEGNIIQFPPPVISFERALKKKRAENGKILPFIRSVVTIFTAIDNRPLVPELGQLEVGTLVFMKPNVKLSTVPNVTSSPE